MSRFEHLKSLIKDDDGYHHGEVLRTVLLSQFPHLTVGWSQYKGYIASLHI